MRSIRSTPHALHVEACTQRSMFPYLAKKAWRGAQWCEVIGDGNVKLHAGLRQEEQTPDTRTT